jgi:hypothetical protein
VVAVVVAGLGLVVVATVARLRGVPGARVRPGAAVVTGLVLVLVLALDPGGGIHRPRKASPARDVDDQGGAVEAGDHPGVLVAVPDAVVVGVAVVGQVRALVFVSIVEPVVIRVLAAVGTAVVVGVPVARVGALLELIQVVDLVPDPGRGSTDLP